MPKENQEPRPLPVDDPRAADPGPDPDPEAPPTLRGGFEMTCALQGLGGLDPKRAAQDGLPAPDFDPFFVKDEPGGAAQTGLTAVAPTEPGGAARERAVAIGARRLHARGAIAVCLTLVLATTLGFWLIASLRARTQRPAALVSPTVLPAALGAPLESPPETPNPLAGPARAPANTSETATNEAMVARHPLAAQVALHRTQSSCIATAHRHAANATKDDAWSTTTPCAAANDIDMDNFSQHFSTKRLEQPP